MSEKKLYRELEDLPGVGGATAEKLKAAGFGEFSTLATASPQDLAETAGISTETAKKIVDAAVDAVEVGYETGDQVFERRKSIGKITTSSKNLDELLAGGVETQAITEAYARFASGKTQLAFQLSRESIDLPVELAPDAQLAHVPAGEQTCQFSAAFCVLRAQENRGPTKNPRRAIYQATARRPNP